MEILSGTPTALLLVALVVAGTNIIKKNRGAARLLALAACSYCTLEVLLWASFQYVFVEFISVAAALGWILLIGFWEEARTFHRRSRPKEQWLADRYLQILLCCTAALLVAVPAWRLPSAAFFGHGWGWLAFLVVLGSAAAFGIDRASAFLWPGGSSKVTLCSSYCLALLIAVFLVEVLWSATGCMGYNGWEVYDTDGYYRGYFGARKEFSIPTIRNSRGYHDVEHEMSRCAETTRILLLGDSFVEAAQVGIEQTVSRQLERAVNAWSPTTPGRKAIECISLGRSGTGSVWQEQTLQREGLEYEPSIVVSEFLPSNDLRDNDFELELRVRWELGYRLNQSSLYRRLRDRRLQALGALLYRIDRLIADIRTGGFPQDRLVYHQPPLDPAWQRAWDRTEDAIIGMKALASGRGAAFVVVVFSTPYEIEAWRNPQQAAAKLAARAARRDLPADGWDFRYPARRVEALCRERGIPVLNLSRVFAELPDQQRGRLHLQSDGHWSPTGHRLAAAAIARFLNDQLQSSAE